MKTISLTETLVFCFYEELESVLTKLFIVSSADYKRNNCKLLTITS